MTEKVKLVALDSDQIALAKQANGERKQITHAVVCGHYGQMFGTEKQCRKYFSAWSHIFPYLFSGGEEISHYQFASFKTTPNLVMILGDAHDPLENEAQEKRINDMSKNNDRQRTKKKGFLAKLLGI